VAAAVAIDPQVARRSALVALPPGRIVAVAADHDATVGVLGKRTGVAQA